MRPKCREPRVNPRGPILAITMIFCLSCLHPELDLSKPWFRPYILAQAGSGWTINLPTIAPAGSPSGDDPRILCCRSRASGMGGGEFRARLYLPPPAEGTYEISGTFTATPFGIGFGVMNGSPGAESGSLESVTGPNPRVSACSVTYVSDQIGAQQFVVRFRVTTDSASVCLQP